MSRRIYYASEKPQGWEPYRLDEGHWAAQGLRGCWLFNEGGGLPQVIPANWAITPYGGIAHKLSINSGVWFDGSDDKYKFALDGLVMDGAHTISVWLYLTAEQPTTGRIISVNNTNELQEAFFVLVSQNRTIMYKYNQSAGSYGLEVQSAAGAVELNKLVNIVFTRATAINDYNQMHIYVNGTEVSYGTRTNADSGYQPCSNALFVGGLGTNNTRQFQGFMIAGSFYNAPLTASQIAALYEQPYQMFYKERPVFISIPAAAPASHIAAIYNHYARLRA